MNSAKGKEPGATWPTPPDPRIVVPRKNLSQLTLPQPPITQGGSQMSNNLPLPEGNARNGNHGSNTWTSSSEHQDLPPEEDGNDDRERFIVAYNQLAQRHGIRPIVPGDFPVPTEHPNGSLGSRQGSWLSKMLRQSTEQSKQTAIKPDRASLRHQRSHSIVRNLHSHKRDGLKNLDLRALVRLCGKSPLFLPPEYAPFSLTLPTCFRALAQALVQNADTKGIFRVSGSARAIDALYDYYCTNTSTNDVSSTTRCPTLPSHIRCNTHDVAGTFKRLLAGLPGGILGSLSLFDALVAIHSQLQGDPESHRTKESRLRARLIALAIGTVESQYQRELICAVFGLLCLVGRIAENAPREDDSGHPLPTTDLMGYHALGIVFGPLLVGDLIDSYSMKVADPSAGLVLLPISAPRSRKEGQQHRHKHKYGHDGAYETDREHTHMHEYKHEHKHNHEHNKHERTHEHKHRHRHRQHKHANDDGPTATSLTVSKIHIANSITEMLIVHWREVVRQIGDTESVKTRRHAPAMQHGHPELPKDLSTSPSAESLSLQHPTRRDRGSHRSGSPSAGSSTSTLRIKPLNTPGKQDNSMKAAPPLLSPTIEEGPSPRIEATKLSDVPSPLRLTRNDGSSEHTDVVSVIRGESGRENVSSSKNPADQWKSIVASSKASIESLAKSAKERRLMRGSGLVSSRPSRETLGLGNSNPPVSARKPLLVSQRSESKLKSTMVSRENSNDMEGVPGLSGSALPSSPIHAGDTSVGDAVTPRRSRRSPSKPLPGAVRAMTALFDNAGKSSPCGPAEAPGGRASNGQSEANGLPGRNIVDESPVQAHVTQPAEVPADPMTPVDNRVYEGKPSQTSPGQQRMKESPTKSFNYTLHPLKRFTATREEPELSPEEETWDMNRNRPPRLGTMVPHLEEPPIGHFLRPSSETSRLSQTASTDEVFFDQAHPRHVSGNSILHTQIRSLQRQLEIKREELLQIRRQLEAQEHMDIGTLCEQLRIAKRECKMWRKRAEAAERRLAIFQQFEAKFQALNDGVNEYLEKGKGVNFEAEIDSLPSYSGHAGERDVFTGFMGHGITGTEAPGGGYDGALYKIDADERSNIGALGEYHLPQGRPRRMDKLWVDGKEARELQQDDSTIVWD